MGQTGQSDTLSAMETNIWQFDTSRKKSTVMDNELKDVTVAGIE